MGLKQNTIRKTRVRKKKRREEKRTKRNVIKGKQLPWCAEWMWLIDWVCLSKFACVMACNVKSVDMLVQFRRTVYGRHNLIDKLLGKWLKCLYMTNIFCVQLHLKTFILVCQYLWFANKTFLCGWKINLHQLPSSTLSDNHKAHRINLNTRL